MRVSTGIIFLLLLGAGCIQKPKFISVENIKVGSVNESNVDLTLEYIAFNPNNVKVTLLESDISVFFEGTEVGKGSSPSAISLNPNDTINIPVLCSIRLKEVSKFLPAILQNRKSQFFLSGEGKVKVLLGKSTFNFSDSIDLNLNVLARKEIKKLLTNQHFRLSNISAAINPLGSSKIDMTVEFQNPMPFDYEIIEQNFDLGINKESIIGSWESNSVVVVKSNDFTRIPSSMTLSNPSAIFGTGLSLMFNKKVPLWINGNMKLKVGNETFDLPIEITKEINLKDILQ